MAGTSGGVGAMAGLSFDELAAFVAASCERSAVPVKVRDPRVIRDVAVLLGGRAGRHDASAAGGRPVPVTPASADPPGPDRTAGPETLPAGRS